MDNKPKCICGSNLRFHCGTSSYWGMRDAATGDNYPVKEHMYSCTISCKNCGIKLNRGKWFGCYEVAKDDALIRWKEFKNKAKKLKSNPHHS